MMGTMILKVSGCTFISLTIFSDMYMAESFHLYEKTVDCVQFYCDTFQFERFLSASARRLRTSPPTEPRLGRSCMMSDDDDDAVRSGKTSQVNHLKLVLLAVIIIIVDFFHRVLH